MTSLDQSLTYRDASRLLMEQATRELSAGDLRQASEKGWGAAAQIVKAVAAQRGWQHRSHAALYNVVERLARQYDDPYLSYLFHAAGNLHTNFYENWFADDVVATLLGRVGTFLASMEMLLESPA